MSGSAATQDRFAARRAELERQADRRRLWMVAGLAGVSTLVMAAIAFVNSSWFDVDDLRVVGNERADTEDIVTASGILPGDGLLSVDAEAAAQAIELVPWVGTAEVVRSWRGDVTITVAERPAAAVVPAGPKFALIDEHGRQLEVIKDRPDGYLPVHGIDASGVPGEAAPAELLPVVALLQAMPEEVEAGIESISVDEGQLSLNLKAGGTALLGDGTVLGAKLQAFETLLARVEMTCVAVLDVRVPEAPTVRRSGGTGVVSDEKVPDSTSSDC